MESVFQRWKDFSRCWVQQWGDYQRFLCNLLFYQHEIIFGTHLAIQSWGIFLGGHHKDKPQNKERI